MKSKLSESLFMQALREAFDPIAGLMGEYEKHPYFVILDNAMSFIRLCLFFVFYTICILILIIPITFAIAFKNAWEELWNEG